MTNKSKKLIRRGPYVGTLASGYRCQDCVSLATWRINTTGLDGAGRNFCDEHAVVVLRRSGNEKLIEQARQRGMSIEK